MIRRIAKEDKSTLLEIATATGIFGPGEVDELLGDTIDAYLSKELFDSHHIYALENQDQIVAWTYFAPSIHAPDVWDIWWIGTHPKYYRKGYGRQLLAHIEETIQKSGGRVVVIETSSTPALEKARAFYPQSNYKVCGSIPNFYGVKDDKVIFSKTL